MVLYRCGIITAAIIADQENYNVSHILNIKFSRRDLERVNKKQVKLVL